MTNVLEFRRSRNASTMAASEQWSEDDTTFAGLDRRRQDQNQWDECIRALLALRSYENDWDGEGASAPSPENISRAIQFVELQWQQSSLPAPKIAAGVSGEVFLVWRMGNASLHAEISRPDVFEWMQMNGNGEAKHWVDSGTPVKTISDFQGC